MINKTLTILILIISLTTSLFSQDDFSLTYNPFNDSINIDSSVCYVPEDYYMDVPVIFSIYDNSKDNYILVEGLVIYQSYYNVECNEEKYWDILQFTNIYYKPFSVATYDILGFRIITQLTYNQSE